MSERVEATGDRALDDAVEVRLQRFAGQELTRRIWARDFTVWGDRPEEVSDRLGWLNVHESMRALLPDLEEFAQRCRSDGFRTVLLAGMGGSSLAPAVLGDVFGVAPGMLDLVVMDTTHPEEILSIERSLDIDETLFVIASKSGTTIETRSHLAYLWRKVPDGSRFVAITDRGTPLEALAAERGFRRSFINPGDIGGRYSALSLFGLVNASLLGVDLGRLLDEAAGMASACRAPASSNPGARLGAAMGEAALQGRDKLTLALPGSLRSLGYWIEQLVAESTGKEGRGIVPVEGEDIGEPDVYGQDRLFVAIGEEGGDAAVVSLERAGHPVIHLPFRDSPDVGREFFRWEFAVAVAGAVLGINPFDQPNVQEAKEATKRALEGGFEPDGFEDPAEILSRVRPGDYVAIQAYLPREEGVERRLHSVRMAIRDRLRVATTVGFGPRFLHSTGQLHKGGPIPACSSRWSNPWPRTWPYRAAPSPSAICWPPRRRATWPRCAPGAGGSPEFACATWRRHCPEEAGTDGRRAVRCGGRG